MGSITQGALGAELQQSIRAKWFKAVNTISHLQAFSVVDSLFSLPLVLFVITATVFKNLYFARIGLVWALCYLGVGYWWHQNER